MAEINREVAKKGEKIAKKLSEETRPSLVAAEKDREGYPAQYVPRKGLTPYEEKIRYYKTVKPDTAIEGVQTVIPFTDEDVQTMKERESMVNQYEFDKWVEGRFNMYDRDTYAMIRRVYPEYTKARLAEMNRVLDLQKKAIGLDLSGIDSFEDLKFLFDADHSEELQTLLAAGYKKTAAEARALEQAKFQRGLVSEFLHKRSEAALSKAKTIAPTAMKGYEAAGGLHKEMFPMLARIYAPYEPSAPVPGLAQTQ